MNYMQKKIIFFFLSVFISISSVQAYNLVLPKDKKSVTNKEYALFAGKALNTETIIINDKKIYTAPNGAFAHSVKLKNGHNRIVIRSDYSTRIYNLKKIPQIKQEKFPLKEFEPKRVIVKNDRTPLRQTPEKEGINRISHLFKGTTLLINGVQGDFYRVYLSKNKYAWVLVNDVEEAKPNEKYKIPEFITMNSDTYKNASVHTIEFTGKLPYTIDEFGNDIVFKVYNPEYSQNSVYTINIKKPEKYVYKTTLTNGTYVFKVNDILKPENNTLEGVKIVIDPGHGGSETGAIGCLGDKEKDIALKIGLELQDRLRLMGADTIMTRECDGYISLDDRIELAQKFSPQIFVSIHLNSMPDINVNIRKNRGTSVYYYNENSKDIARAVQKSITKELQIGDDGIRQKSLKVLRRTEYLSFLVEAAYMTNPLDSVLYRDDGFAYNTAKAIADGILNYLTCD